MSCCRRRAMRAQKQNSDEHRAVSPGRKTFELFSLGPQKKCFYYKELRPQFYQIHWHWGLCHHVTAPSIPTNLSLRLLDPDLPQAMIVGDIHRIARHATHLKRFPTRTKEKIEPQCWSKLCLADKQWGSAAWAGLGEKNFWCLVHSVVLKHMNWLLLNFVASSNSPIVYLLVSVSSWVTKDPKTKIPRTP